MEALQQLSLSEAVTLAGVLIGTALAAYIGYFRKNAAPPPTDPVLTSVGLELGNRKQIDQIITELKRIADALTDKNTAGINERLDHLAETVDALLAERKPRRRT